MYYYYLLGYYYYHLVPCNIHLLNLFYELKGGKKENRSNISAEVESNELHLLALL